MVRIQHVVAVGMLLSSTCAVHSADSKILSVRIASEPTVRIKPCEPAFVVLDVTMELSVGEGKLREIPGGFSKRVTINGRSYPERMPRASSVAFFVLNDSSVSATSEHTMSFLVAVMLYWNVEDEEYLFRDPGIYQIQFHPEGAVDVVVEPPTKEEARVIVEMEDLGQAFAMFMLNPVNRRNAPIIPRVERMLLEYPETPYSRYLSLGLGLYRFSRERPAAGPDFGRFLAERRKLRRYFEPYCRSDIASFHEVQATFALAMLEMEETRAHKRLGVREARDRREFAVPLLEKVRDSAYSGVYGAKAKAKLDQFER